MGPENKRHVVAINAKADIVPVKREFQGPQTSAVPNKAESSSAPKLRRLLPLLPKAKATPASKTTERPAKRRSGPCGIRACEKPVCNLASHRHYVKVQGTVATQKRSTSSTDGSSERVVAASQFGSSTSQIRKTIAQSAGFPILPLNQSEASNPALQHLFHDFFVDQLQGLLKLIVSPFQGYDAWAKKRHDHLFELGVQTQLDCLNFIGAAYLHILGHSPSSQPGTDETGIVVHSYILKGLRTILETFDPARDTDQVLNIMYTLVMFGLATNSDMSASSLVSHKKAMLRVVESCGGLHNCGANLPLAVSLDRLIAIITEEDPIFTTWDNVKLPIQRAPKYAAVYGTFFENEGAKSGIDKDVLAYCVEACRAIEILEGEAWLFDSEPREASGEVYYLYYLRSRVADQFGFLNARLAGAYSRTRCVLLATKLVEYASLWNNYNTMLPFTISDRLLRLLTERNPLIMWDGCEDVLRWILFALLCVPQHWKRRSKALDLCRRTFHILYNGKWPDEWRAEQRALLITFVWSTTKLEKAFVAACNELRA